MSKVTLQDLGLGSDDLSAIGKLSESGLTAYYRKDGNKLGGRKLELPILVN